MRISELRSKLENDHGPDDKFTARCPAHDDHRSSLSVWLDANGHIAVNCFARCSQDAICDSLGITWKDLKRPEGLSAEEASEITYDYRGLDGKLVFQVVRRPGKKFLQRCPDGSGGWSWKLDGIKRVLYRLPELCSASDDEVVYVVEGEKDANRLASLGLVATTKAGGAKSSWDISYTMAIGHRDVVVLPDNDEAGIQSAESIADELKDIARSVKVLRLPDVPEKGDVSDWLNKGHTLTELVTLSKPQQPKTFELATQEFLERFYSKQEEALLSTGVMGLDAILRGGIEPGEIVVIAARPSHGKSLLGLQIVHEWSKLHPCMFVSAEMGERAVAKRVVQYACETPIGKWRASRRNVVENVIDYCANRRSCFFTESKSLPRIEEFIRVHHKRDGAKFLLIDYAQLVEVSSARGETERVATVSRKIQEITHELKLTTIVLCQMNREIDKRIASKRKGEEKKWNPELSDIKDSSQIEQDADVVMFLFWPSLTDQHADKYEFRIFVRKNRSRGFDRGSAELVINPLRQRVEDGNVTHVDVPETRKHDFGHYNG